MGSIECGMIQKSDPDGVCHGGTCREANEEDAAEGGTGDTMAAGADTGGTVTYLALPPAVRPRNHHALFEIREILFQ